MPDSNSDLILQIRLDALRTNLEQVKKVTTSALERGNAHKQLGRLLQSYETEDNIWTSLEYAIAALNKAANLLRFRFRDVTERLQHEGVIAELDAVRQQLNKIIDYTDMGQQIVTTLQRHSVEINTTTQERLEQDFAQECAGSLADITTLEQQLRGAGAAAQGTGTTGADLGAVWQKYEQMLDADGRPLFAEYVDFLGGLTLRDTGLDDRICEMTDKLLQMNRVLGQHLFTVPARQVAINRAMASIVRLSFPDWTIWGIPLAVHEFGHVVAAQPTLRTHVRKWLEGALGQRVEQDFQDWFREFQEPADSSQSRRGFSYHSELIADAFATYSMGPAYAYAAILLELSPLSTGDPETPSDLVRAHVILHILELMDTSAEKPFHAVITNLREAWNAARQRAGGTTGLDTLTRKWVEELDKGVHDYFIRFAPNRIYSGDRWTRLDELIAHLPGDEDPKGALERAQLQDERDLLNAAWAARFQARGQTSWIASRVRMLWEQFFEGAPLPPSDRSLQAGAGANRGRLAQSG